MTVKANEDADVVPRFSTCSDRVFWQFARTESGHILLAPRTRLFMLALASQEALPTFTIRLSLASVLIEDVGDTRLARRHLMLCKEAVQANGDEAERADWKKLWTLCQVHGG